MSNELISTQHRYVIDVSYGINQDGFIAVGTESIVYKGLEIKQDGEIKFSCVLKFKPRAVRMNGGVIDRLSRFKDEEWKIFEDLKDCRSVVKINDVIEDMGDFSVKCSYVPGGVITNEGYFCVVEEFIDGWNLDEFCREEYWKLRRIEPVGNGLSKVVNYSDYSSDEKRAAAASYNYENILKYQDQILLFMINLCEIMQYITEQKYVLHLDIKPENIMVTRYGKELVLIDFGKSYKVTRAQRFAYSNLTEADYSRPETIDRLYQYGTLGYAAPECYSEAGDGSEFPFPSEFEKGKMSVESDIFSLGAAFWECLNIYELVTKNRLFAEDPHAFYQKYFLREDLYTGRDLSCTSRYYHKKLDHIIRKCTRKRAPGYTDPDNKKYYHSYTELKKDLEDARNSVPTIVKEESVKVRNAFRIGGVMLSCFLISLIIYGIYRAAAFHIAMGKWDSLTADYNDTQFYRLEETAGDLIDSASAGQIDSTYEEIAAFTYNGNDISEYEAQMLTDLLQKIDDPQALPQRIDEIMRHANTRSFREISTAVVKLGDVENSIGYDLAYAIYSIEAGKTGILEGYETLLAYQDNSEFRSAVVKLKNVLDNDEYINMIAEANGITRQEVQNFFKTITLEEGL